MDQKCVVFIASSRVRQDDLARGVQNALSGVVINEEGVLRSWLAPVG